MAYSSTDFIKSKCINHYSMLPLFIKDSIVLPSIASCVIFYILSTYKISHKKDNLSNEFNLYLVWAFEYLLVNLTDSLCSEFFFKLLIRGFNNINESGKNITQRYSKIY